MEFSVQPHPTSLELPSSELESDLNRLSSEQRADDLETSDSETVEQFERIEDKFLVPRIYLPRLLKLLEDKLTASYYEPGTEFNMIESVYFDSSALKIFSDHFNNQISRFKLRLRKYGPNGIWPSEAEPVHLEMKSKNLGVSQKFRLKVGRKETAALSVGEPLPTSFALSKKKSKIIDRIWQINGVMTHNHLRPQARVTYRRRAFEKDGLRVTIDDQIKSENLSPVDRSARERILSSTFFPRAKEMRERFLSNDYLVVEVKHDGTMPEWASNFLKEIGCEPASFSKYAFTVSKTLLEP